MHILVEYPPHGQRNVGDAAMLQAAVSRLTELRPDAVIEVVTRHPHLLPLPHESARPVRPLPLHTQALKRMPSSSMLGILRLHDAVRSRIPIGRRRGVLDAVREADLVVASGGGFITDSFQGAASHVLGVLALAIQRGTPIALLGQGVGPLRSPRLRAKAAAVLPSATLITLREGRAGKTVLESLGVPADRVVVTGDDAIEPAFEARPRRLGRGLGLNVRVVGYAGVTPHALESVRAGVSAAAERYDAPLLPIPISHNRKDSDVRAIRDLLARPDLPMPSSLETLDGVLAQVGQCRVVVTGSYHAAVFALAQGIPAVCLSKSDYYDHKFLGLAEQFGGGCSIVALSGERTAERLTDAIDAAWAGAEEVRPALLEAAERQIAAGRAAYGRLLDLVPATRPAASTP
jgi:colanic acid/amylovoran biosynthesis protein